MCQIDRFEGRQVYGDYRYIPEECMDEEWTWIDGFPDYRVSDKGRIWSDITHEFMTPTPNCRTGHLDVCLWSNGRRIHRYVHRLVAEAFIPNPHHYPVVRHLDDDPDNNWVENLAWGTQKDNVHDAIINGHAHFPSRVEIEKANSVRRTPIKMTDLRTGETRDYIGQQAAARDLGVGQSEINNVLRKKSHRAKHYVFEYARKEGD